MSWQGLFLILIGLLVGLAASFTGLGGGIIMVPLLLGMGYEAQKAVGTSFLAILIISVSALVAHGKLANVDWKMGLLLGVGGIVGAQVGARLVEHVSTDGFRKVFAVLLVGVGVYFFAKS
ncbi:MAG: sulfite exporter TauE/SafE family protein [Acidobacteria bacterium]|nr:MAG: sulfite exporter TauE/SafE family protein [Acidobacteriota bacterium]